MSRYTNFKIKNIDDMNLISVQVSLFTFAHPPVYTITQKRKVIPKSELKFVYRVQGIKRAFQFVNEQHGSFLKNIKDRTKV